MATLTDYLDPRKLQQLQDIFVLVTRAGLRIYDAQGQALTAPSDLAAHSPLAMLPEPIRQAIGAARQRGAHAGLAEVPITVQGEPLGRIVLDQPSQARWPAEQVSALANALGVPQARLRRALQQVPDVDAEASHQALAMLALMSEVLTTLCDREQQLGARLEELATLYRLTSLFNVQRDLQKVLDTVATTVVEITRVKGCSIRLLEEETQELRIQAVANLSTTYLDKGAILLSQSRLDSEAFATQDVVYVEDEQTDPRVLYPREARQEGLVSALIAPMIYKGRPVGALHLYTGERYSFDSFDVALVKAIAAQAASAIVNARLNVESERAANTQRQLRMASEVQRRMIPHQAPSVPGLDVAAVYVPSLELAGDYYDFIELPGGNLGVVICDVMGKGIPASLLMASTRASLRAHVSSLYDLSEALRRVNRSLCDDTLISDFATLFYGVIDPEMARLTYANAGHEPPLLVRGGRCRRLEVTGTVLGIERDYRYGQEVLALERQDVLVLVTDGFIETRNFQDEQFGRERLERAILTAQQRGDDARGIAQHVLWELRRFAGLQVRSDDLTLVVVRVLASFGQKKG